jgi:hypothetical protein
MKKCGFCQRRMCAAMTGSSICEPDLYRSSMSVSERIALYEDWRENLLTPGTVRIVAVWCGGCGIGYSARLYPLSARWLEALQEVWANSCPRCGQELAQSYGGSIAYEAWDVTSKVFEDMMAAGR